MREKTNPFGYHSVTPYLTVQHVGELIEFLEKVFGAKKRFEPLKRTDGSIMHAEVEISESVIMMGEPMGDAKSMPGNIYLYVPDIDAAYQRALKEGAVSLSEPANLYYGDRRAGVADPFGNYWYMATHIEDVSPEEMKKREVEFVKERGKK